MSESSNWFRDIMRVDTVRDKDFVLSLQNMGRKKFPYPRVMTIDLFYNIEGHVL